jgi:hypothetical protein
MRRAERLGWLEVLRARRSRASTGGTAAAGAGAAAPPAAAGSAPTGRARLARTAAAGVAVAAGLALGFGSVPAAKRRALLAGGATGLVGAASVVLAGLAAGLHRRRRP